MKNYILHNSVLSDEVYLQSVLNRGLIYGDRFFDTLIFRNNLLEHWQEHLERIRNSASLLHFDNIVAKSSESWQEELMSLVNRQTQTETAYRIRLTVVRQEGGLYRPHKKYADYYAEITPFISPLPVVLHTDFAKKVYTVYSSYSAYKIHTLPYVLAGIEATESSCDDLILCSADGFVSEAISSNIFWCKDDIFYTPTLQTGCVDGILRKKIINSFRQTNCNLVEGFFTPEALLQAKHIWLTNVTGVRSVKQIGSQSFEITQFLDVEIS